MENPETALSTINQSPKVLQKCDFILRSALFTVQLNPLNGQNDSCRSDKFHFNSSKSIFHHGILFWGKNKNKTQIKVPSFRGDA